MPDPYPIDYPINWYSRIVTDSSGTSPSYQYFLTHADRALVSSGTSIVDHSSYGQTIYTRGSGIVQAAAAAYFGTSGIAFTGATALSANARVGWNITGLSTVGGDANGRLPMQIECLFYFTATPSSSGSYFWEVADGVSHLEYAQFYTYQTGTQWRIVAHWFQNALGQYFSHEYNFTLTTGTWHHLVLYRVGTENPGEYRVGIFYDGSQLSPVAGGFPTSGSGDWRDCTFTFPQGNFLVAGGQFLSGTGNVYAVWQGSMDEIRFLHGSNSGVSYDTFSAVYSFSIPTAPYEPLDVTSNVTAKQLVLSSVSLYPAVDAATNLGVSGSGWASLWIAGSARANFRDATTYLFSSAAGYLTFVAGTQLDFQANIGVSAKNFIFDTATGVKIATATNQKLGFFNAAPVVQQSGNIVTALSNLGLVVNGTLGITDIVTVTTTSAAYTLTTADEYLFCNSGTSFAVTLPAAIGSYAEFMVKNIGAGTVTLTANSADLIDSAATTTLAQWAFAKIFDFSPATTGIDASTVLCLHCDGADDSTTFIDSSPLANTVTANGNAKIDTDKSQFGGASAIFDGVNATRLTVGSRTAFYMGASSFTIQLWIYPSTLSGTTAIFTQWGGGGAAGQFYLDSESGAVNFYYTTDGAGETPVATGITLKTGTWQHIAVTRVGTVLVFHKNGALTGTGAGNFTFNNSTRPVNLSTYADGAGQAINGWVDELKWDIGVARYTSASFTVPTSAFGSDATGKWLLIT